MEKEDIIKKRTFLKLRRQEDRGKSDKQIAYPQICTLVYF